MTVPGSNPDIQKISWWVWNVLLADAPGSVVVRLSGSVWPYAAHFSAASQLVKSRHGMAATMLMGDTLTKWRPVLGFLIAPLAPCLLVAIAVCLGQGDLLGIPFAMLLYAFFAYLYALVFGVPAYLLMSRFGYVSLPHVITTGAVLGFASGATIPVVMGVAWARAVDSGLLKVALLFTIFGTLTAYTFWWLVLRSHSGDSP